MNDRKNRKVVLLGFSYRGKVSRTMSERSRLVATSNYVIPNIDSVVLGGTHQKDWNTVSFNKLLSNSTPSSSPNLSWSYPKIKWTTTTTMTSMTNSKTFFNDGHQMFQQNYETGDREEGEVMLFPSSLPHNVISFGAHKVSIAFNIMSRNFKYGNLF